MSDCRTYYTARFFDLSRIPRFGATTISYLRVHVDAPTTMIDQTCHYLTGNTEVRQFGNTEREGKDSLSLSLCQSIAVTQLC